MNLGHELLPCALYLRCQSGKCISEISYQMFSNFALRAKLSGALFHARDTTLRGWGAGYPFLFRGVGPRPLPGSRPTVLIATACENRMDTARTKVERLNKWMSKRGTSGNLAGLVVSSRASLLAVL
jgi:hypothetical protein